MHSQGWRERQASKRGGGPGGWTRCEVRDDADRLDNGGRDEPGGVPTLEGEARKAVRPGEPVGQHQVVVEPYRRVEVGKQRPRSLGAALDEERGLSAAILIDDDCDQVTAEPPCRPYTACEARHAASAIAAWTCSAVAAFAFAKVAAVRA